MEENQKKKKGFRIDIVLIAGLFALLISFCAYMMNTTLEDVLKDEYGSSIVTHDYTYESTSETE